MLQLISKALLLLLLLTITSLQLLNKSTSSPWLSLTYYAQTKTSECNPFRGKWVPNEEMTPYYSIATCPEIFDQQNCMKFGRPDTDFLKWRWKPDNCELLPLFDATKFLELVRGQSMAFVGDSLARNQMQSLLCLLANEVNPVDVSRTADPRFKQWLYAEYNFTVSSFWSPYLVKAIETKPNGSTYNRLTNVYLDEANEAWAAEIETFDYVIVSAGRWFFGPQILYEHGHIVGCHACSSNEDNMKKQNMLYAYRMAFRTTFVTLLRLHNFKGTTFLRTLSPTHFENGKWDEGGTCERRCPDSELRLGGDELELYWTQVEEVREAAKVGMERGLRFRVLDTSEAMVVRPDGHPNHFGHWPHENVTMADCVHWCLPGPIDTWNQFLLHMLETEGSDHQE